MSGSCRTNVSRETNERLRVYAELLRKWNRTINLISRRSEADQIRRHFDDSLQLVRFIPVSLGRAIDLGSGAGFPGLVLAIATGTRFELIEADLRKAAFLREAAAATEADVCVHAARIEHLQLPAAPLVTARALAPLSGLLGLAAPFMEEGSEALFLKGGEAERELTDARADWHMVVQRHQSATDPTGVILRLTEVRRA